MLTTDQILAQLHTARSEGRLAEARSLASQAAAIARSDGTTTDLAESLKAVGRIDRDEGNFEKALASYEDAAELYRNAGTALKLAHTLRHVGDIQSELGNFSAARDACSTALQIYRLAQDAPPLDLANAIRSCALLEEHFNGRLKARPLWEEAKTLYASVEVWAGVDECAAHLSS